MQPGMLRLPWKHAEPWGQGFDSANLPPKVIMIKLIKLKSFEDSEYSYFFANELDECVSKIFTEQEINEILLSATTEICDDSWTILPR